MNAVTWPVTWPAMALWRLITSLVILVGRAMALVIGLGLVVAGGVLTITIIGAPLGIPLLLAGLLFIARSLF